MDVFGKIKLIKETDNRLNEARFLPYQPGDCPGGGVACSNNAQNFSPGHSTADLYGNPPVITVNGVTGYQWKPFNSLSDDDRDLRLTKRLAPRSGHQGESRRQQLIPQPKATAPAVDSTLPPDRPLPVAPDEADEA